MGHSLAKYVVLKTLVSFVRVMGWFRHNTIRASPDSKYSFVSRDGKRNVAVHVYKPKQVRKPGPVLLNWHSSGHVLNLHGQDDLFCRHVADHTDYIVLDATYGLAPEHTFPGPLEDVEDLILSVLNQPDLYDAKNIVLCGFSAGSTLALAAASNPLSKIPRDAIRSIIAFYPPTDLAADPKRKQAPETPTETLPAWVLRVFAASYVPKGVSPSDPRISPFYAKPENFPDNVLIITRAKDALCVEGEALGHGLRDHGKNVIMERVTGFGQSWDKVVVEGSEGARKRDDMYNLAVKFLIDAKL